METIAPTDDSHPRGWRRARPILPPLAVLWFGFAYACVTVPFGVPDEFAHFWRAYDVSEGHLVAARQKNGERVAMLPRRVVDMVDAVAHYRTIPLPPVHTDRAGWERMWRTGLHPEDRMLVGFSNTALHSPVLYLPAAAGIGLARLLHASVLHAFYFARFGNVVAAALLVAFACRRLRAGNALLLVAALLPMTLFLFGSVSADALTIALTLAWVAMVVDLCARDERPGIGDTVLLLALAAAIGQAKLSLPLALLALAPCWRRPRPDRWLLATCGSAVAVAIGSAWLWNFLSDPFHVPVRQDLPVDPSAQLGWVLAHPLPFAGVLGATVVKDGVGTFQQLIGVFGWLQTTLPAWVYAGGLLALVLAVCLPDDGRIPRALRLLCAVAVPVCLMLTYLAVYLTFTGVGAESIEGVQGRYFLPLILPAGLIFHNATLGHGKAARAARAFLALYLVAANLAGVWIQFSRGWD